MGSRGKAPGGGPGGGAPEAHELEHFKSPRKPVSEGKIHTFTPKSVWPQF